MHWSNFGLWVLLSLLVAGCGFALRSDIVTDRISGLVIPDTLTSDVRVSLERAVRDAGVTLSKDRSHATHVIESIQENKQIRSTRLDPLGRTVEFWIALRWDITTVFQGQHTFTLHASESIGLDESSLIASEKEKRRVLSVLRTELATQLIQQLAYRGATATQPQRAQSER